MNRTRRRHADVTHRCEPIRDLYAPATRRRTRRLPALALLLALATGLALAGAVRAEAQERDTVGAIHAAAQNRGVPAGPLLDLARCESRFDADAAGDYRWRGGRWVPTSLGPFQINDLPTGLDGHFRRQGYTDRTDPEQSADYVARVLRGDFAADGVTLRRWSCYAVGGSRLVRGGA